MVFVGVFFARHLYRKNLITIGDFFKQKYGRGVLRDYVRPYLDKLNPGDITVIPAGEFDLTAVSMAAFSYAHQTFGKGAWTGATNAKNKTFELMRLEV